jgi:hypothetical protein
MTQLGSEGTKLTTQYRYSDFMSFQGHEAQVIKQGVSVYCVFIMISVFDLEVFSLFFFILLIIAFLH